MREQHGVPRELLNRARTVNTTDDVSSLSSDVHQRRGTYTSPVSGDVDEGLEERHPRSSIVRRGPPRSVGQTSPRTVMRVQHHPAIPPRASRTCTQEYQEPELEPVAARERSRLRLHWLVYVGGAMLIALLGWMALSAFSNWWQIKQDDWHYGRPRTFQVDAVVGHSDSASNPSHFIALNLRGQIEIIEFPGGQAAKAKVYIGPDLLGPGQDLAPVTLSFKDVTGDGKPDMIVIVESSRFVFLNDHGAFRPAKPGEAPDMPGGGS